MKSYALKLTAFLLFEISANYKTNDRTNFFVSFPKKKHFTSEKGIQSIWNNVGQ